MPNIIDKVTVFITRSAADGHHLLLFEHPATGIQIPAGTVEAEETGLTSLTLHRILGAATEILPAKQRIISQATPVYARPDMMSFDWARLRRGITVEVERQVDGFSQVTYIEYDRLDDPQFITYQITGWVPTERLAEKRVRHFFHFEYKGVQIEPWWIEADNHRFRLFCAPLTELPTIVKPQDKWVDVLLQYRKAASYPGSA